LVFKYLQVGKWWRRPECGQLSVSRTTLD
jgi:hypothetical protein